MRFRLTDVHPPRAILTASNGVSRSGNECIAKVRKRDKRGRGEYGAYVVVGGRGGRGVVDVMIVLLARDREGEGGYMRCFLLDGGVINESRASRKRFCTQCRLAKNECQRNRGAADIL